MSMTYGDEPLLEKPKYRRDEQGQFARPEGFTLRKFPKIRTPKNKTAEKNLPRDEGGVRAGPGRPKGSKNKTTLALREAILRALDKLGGDDYLVRLGIENSSAFAGLLGKVLPHSIAAEDKEQLVTKITFERRIVYPKEHPPVLKQIEHQADPVIKPGLLPDPKPAAPQDRAPLGSHGGYEYDEDGRAVGRTPPDDEPDASHALPRKADF